MPTKPLPQRRLGKNGPTVPAMGFGLMGMSHTYPPYPSDEERFIVLDRALELGETFWDTADIYGDNEELIGKWFKRTKKRNEIFLATKFGYVSRGGLKIDSSYEYCKQACDKSLKTLGIDCIDLYYAHNLDKDTPVEQTMRALAELQAEGKIRHIGLSSISSNSLRRAVKIAPVAAVQVDYSIASREIEGAEGTNILATCRELGVAVVAAMPLSRGLISSRFSEGQTFLEGDIRPLALPRFKGDNAELNRLFVKKLSAFAEEKGCTVAQLALAWLIKQGDDIIPIPGTKQIKYLEQNLGALDVTLTDADEAKIREFLKTDNVAGTAVPESYMSMLYQDTKEESK